jgi:hypothetical protein
MPIGREISIYLSAIDFESDSQREAYLSEAYEVDRALRKAVDELLEAHNRPVNVVDEQQGRHLDLSAAWEDAPIEPKRSTLSTTTRSGRIRR